MRDIIIAKKRDSIVRISKNSHSPTRNQLPTYPGTCLKDFDLNAVIIRTSGMMWDEDSVCVCASNTSCET